MSFRCSVDEIPIIRVAHHNGYWVTADNRRLWVFRQLERLGKCDEIQVQMINYIIEAKLTSTNDGESVRVRGDPGGVWHRKPTRTSSRPKPSVPRTRLGQGSPQSKYKSTSDTSSVIKPRLYYPSTPVTSSKVETHIDMPDDNPLTTNMSPATRQTTYRSGQIYSYQPVNAAGVTPRSPNVHTMSPSAGYRNTAPAYSNAMRTNEGNTSISNGIHVHQGREFGDGTVCSQPREISHPVRSYRAYEYNDEFNRDRDCCGCVIL